MTHPTRYKLFSCELYARFRSAGLQPTRARRTWLASASTALTTPLVADASFGEDISCGTDWTGCNGNMLLSHFNEALVLYICVSAVCTLGILQDNGLLLAMAAGMFSGENTVLSVPCLTQSPDYVVLHLQSTFLFREQPKSL